MVSKKVSHTILTGLQLKIAHAGPVSATPLGSPQNMLLPTCSCWFLNFSLLRLLPRNFFDSKKLLSRC